MTGRGARWRPAAELLLLSALVLFQELALIRWLGGQVRVLAYFPNLILVGSFLGLGLGCLRAGKKSLLWLWPAGLLALTAAAVLLGRVVFTQESPSEHLWLLYSDLPAGAPVVKNLWSPLLAVFLLTLPPFAAMGQAVGDRLQAFRERGEALGGYGWDIGGSLLGVLIFTALGFSGAFPAVWFAVALAAGSVFFAAGRSRLLYVLSAGLILALVHGNERAQVYSPYYGLSTQEAPAGVSGFSVLANGSLHQHALDMRRGQEGLSEMNRFVVDGYHFPYRLLDRPVRRALVLGAGTGNDVAVLLDEGAERVDAVEIDPAILALGRKHPNTPYDSPRVTVFNTDARSFLNASRDNYDLIVFGTLDSMTRLSAMSGVRLDNFVYTRECLAAARDRLTPDGGLVLYFMVSEEYIFDRLLGLVFEAFGELPAVDSRYHNLFNTVLMAGPAFKAVKAPARAAARESFARQASSIQLPSDDWPYLYLKDRSVQGFYLCLILCILLIASAGVFWASPALRGELLSGKGPDWPMFLFGLGFLLLEARAVVVMGAAWGATWLTSAVVFGAILAVVLSATLAARRWAVPWTAGLAGLLAALALSYFFPFPSLARAEWLPRLVLSVVAAGGPLFFASLCFAVLFKERPESGTAFGWNLLGAVVGGLTEFLSMSLGLKALLLVAAAAYLTAAFFRQRDAAGVPARR